jgi:hypothetical protein
VPVPGAGAVGDLFNRERLVVAAVEGELPAGPLVGAQGVGAEGDTADPGALEAEGVVLNRSGFDRDSRS